MGIREVEGWTARNMFVGRGEIRKTVKDVNKEYHYRFHGAFRKVQIQKRLILILKGGVRQS